MGLGGMLGGMGGDMGGGGGIDVRPGGMDALSQFQGNLKNMSHGQRAAHFPGFVDGQTAPPAGWGGITINDAQSTQNLAPMFAQANATGQTNFAGGRDPLDALWSGDTTGGVAGLNRRVSAKEAGWDDRTVADWSKTHYRRVIPPHLREKQSGPGRFSIYNTTEWVPREQQGGVLSTMEQQLKPVPPTGPTTDYGTQARSGTFTDPDDERGGYEPAQEEEQPITPAEAQRQIRDPLQYLALTEDARKNRFAAGMTSPDTLLRNAGRPMSPQMAVDWSPAGGPRMPMPDPARNYGPRAMFNPIEADELSRMLEEYQISNPYPGMTTRGF